MKYNNALITKIKYLLSAESPSVLIVLCGTGHTSQFKQGHPTRALKEVSQNTRK